MVKSAPTIPLGPAALLGSSSTANSTARGASALCAEWCQGALSLKFTVPHPLLQFKRNCWTISPAHQSKKKHFAVHGGSPLCSQPPTYCTCKPDFFQTSQLGVHTQEK